MDKVCFVVGEGGSERYFLASLLEHQRQFQEYEYLKNGYIYQKENVFWVLNSPPDICSRTGESRVISGDTYNSLRAQECAHAYCFSEPYEPHYLIIRDGDHAPENIRQEMVRDILAVSQPVLPKEPIIQMPTGVIENWFFAGLTEDFEHFKTKEKQNACALLREDVDNIANAKERLDNVLVDRLSGLRKIIGNEIGSVFDVELASQRSGTFNDFWEELDRLGLV